MAFQQDEPNMKPGLADQKNAVIVPHIASASKVRKLLAKKISFTSLQQFLSTVSLFCSGHAKEWLHLLL